MHKYSQDLHNYILHIPSYSCILSMEPTFSGFQDPGVANPPSLLLPLSYLLRASDPKRDSSKLAQRAGLSIDDFRQVLQSITVASNRILL